MWVIVDKAFKFVLYGMIYLDEDMFFFAGSYSISLGGGFIFLTSLLTGI